MLYRRDSVSRSDTSGSSAGDLGEITPCNASPHMTGMISYRVPIRDEVEEQWRRNIESLLFNPAMNYAPDLLMQMYRVVKVCCYEINLNCSQCRRIIVNESDSICRN